MPVAKKKSKTIVFNEDKADQSLLSKAERLVRIGKYPSFGDLCKQALEDFLTPPGPASSLEPDSLAEPEAEALAEVEDPPSSWLDTTVLEKQISELLTQHFASVEQRLVQLQELYQRLEQPAEAAPEADETIPLLNQHFGTVEQQLSQLQDLFKHLEQQLTLRALPEPEVKLPVAKSFEPDHSLDGLRLLLEEF